MIKRVNADGMIFSGFAQFSCLSNGECSRSSVLHGKLKIKQEKYQKLMLAGERQTETEFAVFLGYSGSTTDQFVTNLLNEEAGINLLGVGNHD